MPFKLTFLSADVPLTKTITRKADGSIKKSGYPMVGKFTSETIEIRDLLHFNEALVKRANSPEKPCLLKGTINTSIVNASRAGSTKTNDTTQWVCLDLDNAKFSAPEEVMRALGLGDLSYIVQYSSSYKLSTSKNLSCHIFFVLSKPVPAPRLKAWLMHLNLNIPAFETGIILSSSQQCVHWPLDITACQNDKLLYVSPPIFVGMQSPVSDRERIQLIIKGTNALDVSKMPEHPIAGLKQKQRAKLNQLRTAAGLKPQTIKIKQVGEYEVQTGADEISKYEEIDCGEYVRFNLNGGDSQAYWHRKGDLTYLHNFKGEPSLILKEVLPAYYAEQVKDQRAGNRTPSGTGDLVLCFQERVTGEYWWGTWNPEKQTLDINSVNTADKLSNAVRSYGVPVPDPLPIWEKVFNPHMNETVDEEKKVVNSFKATRYMLEAKKFKKGEFPIIQRLLDSAVGTGEIQDHFVNWLAVMWQFRVKPQTAWVLHGNQGTGKGVFWNRVIRKLFGYSNTSYSLAHSLKEQFNGYLENALVACIDEIDADMFTDGAVVEAKLKVFITEPTLKVRRMRTDEYEIPSYTGLLFFSNMPRPVSIPASDRRYNIGKFQPDRFITTSAELDKIEDELEAFTAFLTAYKADPHRAAQVLDTEDRREIQRLSITSTQEIATAILKGDLEYLWSYVTNGSVSNIIDPIESQYNAVVYRLTRDVLNGQKFQISREEIHTIFQLSNKDTPKGNRFTSFLRHQGVTLSRLRVNGALIYGYETMVKLEPELRRMLVENLAAATKPLLRGVT